MLVGQNSLPGDSISHADYVDSNAADHAHTGYVDYSFKTLHKLTPPYSRALKSRCLSSFGYITVPQPFQKFTESLLVDRRQATIGHQCG